jgi:hypothetical protein
MTREHWESIARILRAHRAPYNLVARFANYFYKLNPDFDQVEFMHMAGIWGVYQPEED